MGGDANRLVLSDEPGSVSRARSFAIDRAIAAGHADLAPSVELVTSELVTNGLLHAGPPVELSVRGIADGVRVEVADRSRVAPLRTQTSQDSMTGRGLALVEALSIRWGADQNATGKVIWSELSSGAPPDSPAALGAWTVPEPRRDGEPRYTVVLGDVPTDLLLAAKAHVDNLVREFTLAAAGTAQTPERVPAQLAELVDAVVHGFAEARKEIRRQALEAFARGDERTRLVLTLPASAADAGEAYLAALDQADSYALAARLLTLETPPQHRAFRRWYVESLVDQLRNIAAGRTPAPPKTLEQRLLGELDVVATAQRASDRAARLHAVAAALAGATAPEEVAIVAVSEGMTVLGADRGALVLRQPDGTLTVPAAVGHSPALLERMDGQAPDSVFPVGAALQSGEPVWIESRQQRDEEFPALGDIEPVAASLCAYPVAIAGAVVGVLRFSFDGSHLFDNDERLFVAALAAQSAQALDRSRAQVAEQTALAAAEALAERLARLQQVTAELTAVDDVEVIAEIIVTHAAAALGAQHASVSLLVDERTLEVVRHSAGMRTEGWSRYPVDADTPAGLALLTNRPVSVTTGRELDERFPVLAGQTSGERPLVCVPMTAADRPLGVISLSFPADHDDDPAEIGFLTTLADTCSQAIDRARAMAAARTAADKLAFLAAASADLAESLDHRTTLANVARLLVPRLADWCSVALVEDGVLQTVAVSHIDPEKVRFAVEIERRYPTRLDQPSGTSEVINTGRSQLHPLVTDDMLVAGAVDETHLDLLRQIGMTSVLMVPVSGRAGTFGAISLVSAESGRHYTAEDLSFVEDFAGRVAIAVENAAAFQHQSGRLAAITRVAEAAQHAILAPAPPRVGPVRLAAAYVSAAKEALVGGDLYEVVRRDDAVRLLIGDVRGKGLEAVRLATVVLGEFRGAALDRSSLADVAAQMDRRLASYLGDEDFVTALIAEIRDDGTCALVTCGHPPAFLSHDGQVVEVGESGSPPLGLGADPAVATVVLAPGDRLLLFTDGLIEARDVAGRFVDVTRAVATLATGPLETVLARLLAELRSEVGGDLGDDLALLLAEFAPDPQPAAPGEAEAAPGLVSQPGDVPTQLDSRTARSP